MQNWYVILFETPGSLKTIGQVSANTDLEALERAEKDLGPFMGVDGCFIVYPVETSWHEVLMWDD